MNRQTVAIIGAGVSGLCTAYYASQQGYDVTVIDKGSKVSWNSSFANAGMICPTSHFVPMAEPSMRWMALNIVWHSLFDEESPLYIKMSRDRDFLGWGMRFMANCSKKNVLYSAE